MKWVIAIACLVLAVSFLLFSVEWQNTIRSLMQMELLDSSRSASVASIAVLVAVVLIGISRWIGGWITRAITLLRKVIPPRIANFFGVVVVALVMLTLFNDLVLKTGLDVMDNIYAQADRLTGAGVVKPENPLASGSSASRIDWDTIGKKGQDFVALGPTKEEITAFTGEDALDPLRIYVGLRTRDTYEERAELALDELKRTGAFDRSLLVIGTPTGSGWHDPDAMDSLEYLHNGDTAIVSVQYSYLPSWLVIVVAPERSKISAKILFDEVYGYWSTLPKNTRPKLYVYGMSLGALSTEVSADPFALLDDTIQGGVLAGPPFPSQVHPYLVENRNKGSLYQLPTFRDGSLVRFTARENALDLPGAEWGDVRFVYIQHASDPMVFFSPSLLFEKPEWIINARGPDVSPEFSWFPIVTLFQMLFDLPASAAVPAGYAHHYSAESYIDAWVAVTQPEGWTADAIARLKAVFAKRNAEADAKYG